MHDDMSDTFQTEALRTREAVYLENISYPEKDIGLIALGLWWVLLVLQHLSLGLWWLVVFNVHKRDVGKRARMVDGYVILTDISIAALEILSAERSLLVVIVGARIFEIAQMNIMRHLIRASDRAPAHHFRTVVMAVWNYIEIALGFATIYWQFHLLDKSEGLSACCYFYRSLYFSFITQLTIGYGDVQPAPGWGRSLVVLQGVAGFLFAAILIGRFVSLVPAPKKN